MKKSTRALVAMIVIDLALVLGASWLVSAAQNGGSSDPAGATQMVTTLFGTVIGIVTGFLFFAWHRHRRAERSAGEE